VPGLVCAACATENREGARFCDGCGAALTAPVVERRKLVTSVFCDLSGSTAMGEAVDAESVFDLMRSYFDTSRAAVERHGGAVEKFIGDAVVGMFGVPEANEDDALRACRAALEIREQTTRLGISVRIGVNTGEVVAGDAARREMFASGDAVVLGDSVNVAARLEQAAAPGEVLIGEETFRLVSGAVTVETVPPVEAKGKSEPLVAYRLVDASARGALPRREASHLVGRVAELAAVEREFEVAVEERRCRLVTIVGEPGVGKSRLAGELFSRLDARTVRGACLSYGDGITYWALGQIVTKLTGILERHSSDEARAQIDRFLAAAPDAAAVSDQLVQLLGLGEGVTSAEQLAWAFRRFLTAAAAERPLAVLVDDIHWAEPALLELLAGVTAAAGPIIVLCTARPELLDARPDWPATVRLEPLGASEVEVLLEALDAPAATRVRIARASAGNPLFAEELVAWAGEGGDLDAIPTSLNALLGSRLDRLDSGARDALERGAVEGELFHEGTVVELSDVEARQAVPGELGALARKDLIRMAAAGLVAGSVAYRFKHILVREAAYRATSKKLRAALHERFAYWLEGIAGERVGEYEAILGYHLEQAHRYRVELGAVDDETRALGERAADFLAAAGRRALERSDNHAGVNLLERALAIGLSDPRARVLTQLELFAGLNRVGRLSDRPRLVEEALATATRIGDRALAARVRVSAMDLTMWEANADLVEHQKRLEEEMETLEDLDDQVGALGALRTLSQMLIVQGRPGGRAAYDRTLAMAEALGERTAVVSICVSMSFHAPAGARHVDDAIRRCEELLRKVRGDRVAEAQVSRGLALGHAMAGHAREAQELVAQSERVLAEIDPPTLGPNLVALDTASRALVLTGKRREGKDLWRLVWRKRQEGSDKPDGRAVRAALELALLCCEDGEWDEVERCLASGEGDSGSQSAVRSAVRARVAAHQGRHSEASALATQAIEAAERRGNTGLQARMWETLAEVHRAAGDEEGADAATTRALELFDLIGNVAGAANLRAAVTA
jgi:class 3 adenylate cyclase/predicted ATPase